MAFALKGRALFCSKLAGTASGHYHWVFIRCRNGCSDKVNGGDRVQMGVFSGVNGVLIALALTTGTQGSITLMNSGLAQ